MTHAEALYAYNQWIAMNDWVDGLDRALGAGALTYEEIPELLRCHEDTLDKAIEATAKFNRTDLAEPLRKYRVALRKAIAGITSLNRQSEQTESQ